MDAIDAWFEQRLPGARVSHSELAELLKLLPQDECPQVQFEVLGQTLNLTSDMISVGLKSERLYVSISAEQMPRSGEG